jgi:hypothetical protein
LIFFVLKCGFTVVLEKNSKAMNKDTGMYVGALILLFPAGSRMTFLLGRMAAFNSGAVEVTEIGGKTFRSE